MFGFEGILQTLVAGIDNGISSLSVSVSNSLSSVSSSLQQQQQQPIVNPASSYSIAPGQTVVFSGSWGSSSSSQTLIAMPQGWYMIQWNSCYIMNSVQTEGFGISWANGYSGDDFGTGAQGDNAGVTWGDGNMFMWNAVYSPGSVFVHKYLSGYNYSNLIVSNTGNQGFSGNWYVIFHRFY